MSFVLRIKDNRIVFGIMYVLLLLDSGFYFAGEGGFYLIVQFLLSILLMVVCRASILKKSSLIYLLFFNIVLISSFFNNDDIRNIVVTLLELSSAFFISASYASYKKTNLFQLYSRIIFCLCIFSLVAFVITMFNIGIIRLLPIFHSANGVAAYFWGLSYSYVPSDFYIARNLGLFWEPGAFQFYIILALIYELFVGGAKKRAYIYTLTILTTLSSVGVVCVFLTWICYAVSINLRNIIILSFCIIFIFLLIYNNYNLLPESIRFHIIDKVVSVFNGNENNYLTVATRTDSIIFGFQLILSNILFGIGRGLGELRLITGTGILSCTPINWALQYGLLFGFLSLMGVYLFVRELHLSNLLSLCIFFILLLSLSTEAFNLSPTVFFIVFLGYSIRCDKDNTIFAL